MPDVPDQELIREYGRAGAEEAFDELVHRHVDLVYSTAFRVLRDASLAEEVTQRVFVALARNAGKLQHRVVLTGWLHETARNFAVTTARSEERRRQREREAATLKNLDSSDSQDEWDRIAPHLDGALALLSEADRETILLRYLERKTAREIGARFGLTEEAAQKRAARALDRLRSILTERGLAAPTAGLASLLSVQAIQSAPVGLTASVIGAAATAGAGVSATSTFGFIMASTKVKLGLAAVLVAGVSTPLIIQHQTNARLRNEVATLRQQSAELERLRDEKRRLAAVTVDPQETALRRDEHTELMRLRGEVGGLRAQVKELSKTRNENPSPKSSKPNAPDAPPIRAENWANVGLATPAAAFQTLRWARANQDFNVLAKSLAWADEPTRAKLDAVFASAPESVRSKYGSAEAYVLSQVYSRPPDDPMRMVGFRILSEEITGDVAIVEYEGHSADGNTKTEPMKFVRIGGEWREALDFADRFIDRLSANLQAEANPRTQLDGGRQ